MIDVLDPGEDKILTHINKVYAGGGGCAACCRMVQDLNNYVVSFTPGESRGLRSRALCALFLRAHDATRTLALVTLRCLQA